MSTPLVSRKIMVRAALAGFAIAAVLVSSLLGPRVYAQPSAYSPFKQIKLGMTRSQMEDILRARRIVFHCADASQNPAPCEFSDFWREYRIAVDSQAHRVNRKSFAFKRSRFIK